MALEYNLDNGGEKVLSLNIDWLRMKHNICRGYAVDQLYDIKDGLKKNTEKVNSLNSVLQKASSKNFRIGEDVKEQLSKTESLLKVASNAEEKPERRVEALRQVEILLDSLEFSYLHLCAPLFMEYGKRQEKCLYRHRNGEFR